MFGQLPGSKLEFVGFADEVDCEVLDDFEGFVFVEAVFGDEAAEEGAVNATGYVVAGGDGEEGAGIVVEAYGVVEASGFGDLFAEIASCLRGSRGTTRADRVEGRIVAGQRGEFAGEAGLVEGEEYEGEAGVVAVLVEERAEVAGVLGGRGHIGAFVATEFLVDEAVVVADGARVELHGEAVFDRHARHLGEHLGLEDLLLFWDGATGEDAGVERLGGGRIEVCGHGGEVAVIGGGAAHGLEEGATVAEGVEVAVVSADVLAGDLA